MAIETGNIITLDDIYMGFINNVYNPIVLNCRDINSIPYDYSSYGSFPMIDSSILGNLQNLATIVNNILINIGIKNGSINAIQIATYMTLALQQLTKVGTWWYGRYYNDHGTQSLTYSNGGKCLFNDNYIRSLSTLAISTTDPEDEGDKSIISSRAITTYYSNLLNLWNNTSKQSISKATYTCHSNCHHNCHNDCHDRSGCYK